MNTVLQLQHMLRLHNPYIDIFLTAKERLAMNENISLYLKTVDIRHFDRRRYNHPTASEVAVIMPGTGEGRVDRRDIILETKSHRLKRISELHSAYCALRYPLLFPNGQQGWHPNFLSNDNRYMTFCFLFSSAFIDIVQGHQPRFHKEIIIHIIYIIAQKVLLRSYIMPVACCKNSQWMPTHKSSRIASITSDSIRPNYVPIFIRVLWTLSLMAEIYRILALVPFSLLPSLVALERCGSNIMMLWPSSVLTPSPTSLSR